LLSEEELCTAQSLTPTIVRRSPALVVPVEEDAHDADDDNDADDDTTCDTN
jgi:hypothetical protein